MTRSTASVEAYRKANPKKSYARRYINRQIKSGWIIKPDICSECNKNGRIVGHHDDYDRVWEVRWLCEQCHHDWHDKNGPGANG